MKTLRFGIPRQFCLKGSSKDPLGFVVDNCILHCMPGNCTSLPVGGPLTSQEVQAGCAARRRARKGVASRRGVRWGEAGVAGQDGARTDGKLFAVEEPCTLPSRERSGLVPGLRVSYGTVQGLVSLSCTGYLLVTVYVLDTRVRRRARALQTRPRRATARSQRRRNLSYAYVCSSCG